MPGVWRATVMGENVWLLVPAEELMARIANRLRVTGELQREELLAIRPERMTEWTRWIHFRSGLPLQGLLNSPQRVPL